MTTMIHNCLNQRTWSQWLARTPIRVARANDAGRGTDHRSSFPMPRSVSGTRFALVFPGSWQGMRAIALCLLLAIVTLAPSAAAAAGGWEGRIRTLESRLDSHQWKEAVDQSVKVRAKLLKKFRDPGVTPTLIAKTLVVQAIAEANLGRDDDALWHWHAAQNYLAGLPAMDLSAYGRAAQILAGRALDDVPATRPAAAADPQRRRRRDHGVEIRRPVPPEYPKSLAKSGVEGAVVVKIIVGTGGRAHQPVVLDAGLVPAMAFPALEALKDWLFSPAERDGQPVAVYFELKIRYR